MLGPSDGVTNRARLFRSRGAAICLGRVEERFLGDSTILFDHLRRVPRKMFLQKLEYAPWMLESFVFIIFIQVRRSVPALLLMASLFFRVLIGMRLALLAISPFGG